MKKMYWGFVALAIAALSACQAMGPNFVPPEEPVPKQYAGVTPASADGVGPRPTADTRIETFWWKYFHDATLDRLEASLAADNLDLQAAYLRIVESRIEILSARAQGLPSVKATASYNREQLGAAGILKAEGFSTSSSSTQALVQSIEDPINLYQLGFDASWELDVFGKVRRSVEIAKAQSESSVEARNDMLVSLRAELAQTYFQLRANQMLRDTALQLITTQRETVELVISRNQHGLASEADVDAARGTLSSLESQLPSYSATIESSRHALAVLTGRSPEALDGELSDPQALPLPLAEVPVGIPSSLARRRPDIRKAEATLHAATAQIGVSVASLFPDISLTGSIGLRNLGTRYLFDWQSKFYSFGPSVSLPIFQGGALVANVRLARAQEAEAALSYRSAVLTALSEVEDGLTFLREDAARTAALSQTVDFDQRSFELSLASYKHGLTPYTSALTLQIQAIQARQQWVQAQLTQTTDLVKLYKALGGGWNT